MAKSNKHSRTNCRHPAFLVLLHPIRFFFMLLVKILVLLLAHPTQVFTFVVVSVTEVYFLSIIDSFVALILPLKPFHLLYSHIKSSAKIITDTLITCMQNILQGFGKALLTVTGLCDVFLPIVVLTQSGFQEFKLSTLPHYFRIGLAQPIQGLFC
jgi:hypothetical protein